MREKPEIISQKGDEYVGSRCSTSSSCCEGPLRTVLSGAVDPGGPQRATPGKMLDVRRSGLVGSLSFKSLGHALERTVDAGLFLFPLHPSHE